MSFRFLLDTNAVSDILRERSPALRRRWFDEREGGNRVGISALTHAELTFGFRQNPAASRLRAACRDFLDVTRIVPWTEEAAESYATLRLELKSRGLVVDTIDLLLASHAHSLGAAVVTRDTDFDHFAGLVEVVNWATDWK